MVNARELAERISCEACIHRRELEQEVARLHADIRDGSHALCWSNEAGLRQDNERLRSISADLLAACKAIRDTPLTPGGRLVVAGPRIHLLLAAIAKAEAAQ